MSHYLTDVNARLLLEKELDWDNKYSKDLTVIADSMTNWETCSPSLKLTEIEIDDLKKEYHPGGKFLR